MGREGQGRDRQGGPPWLDGVLGKGATERSGKVGGIEAD